MAPTKQIVDISREIANIRNAKDPRSNWTAIALEKLQAAVRKLQGG